jgi:hypothetical protein
MSARTKGTLFVALVLCLIVAACSNWDRSVQQNESHSARSGSPYVQRYVPVGGDPSIALDTQTGMLCRTVDDANDPLRLFDPTCAVTPEQKKLGFVPTACKKGVTWVRGEGDATNSKFTKLPTCQSVIVVTEEDMKKAGAK